MHAVSWYFTLVAVSPIEIHTLHIWHAVVKRLGMTSDSWLLFSTKEPNRDRSTYVRRIIYIYNANTVIITCCIKLYQRNQVGRSFMPRTNLPNHHHPSHTYSLRTLSLPMSFPSSETASTWSFRVVGLLKTSVHFLFAAATFKPHKSCFQIPNLV